MYKKISGVDNSDTVEVQERARQARADFQASVAMCKDMRDQYMQMKRDNDLEREQLKKEERMAKSFKFTKMSKKVAFLPTLHTKGFLDEKEKYVDQGCEFVDSRVRQALIYPDKVNEKLKFNLVATAKTGMIG